MIFQFNTDEPSCRYISKMNNYLFQKIFFYFTRHLFESVIQEKLLN